MTTSSLSLKMGSAPSHTAQALMPLFQRVSSPGTWSRLAVAPVEMMTLWVSTSRSVVLTLKGPLDRSTSVTSSWKLRVPNSSAWARNFCMRSGPLMPPSGKPG